MSPKYGEWTDVVWTDSSEYFLKSRSQQDKKNCLKLFLTWADSLEMWKPKPQRQCERRRAERTRTVLSLDDGRLHLVQVLLHSQLLVFDHFLLLVHCFLYLLTHDLWSRARGQESSKGFIHTRACQGCSERVLPSSSRPPAGPSPSSSACRWQQRFWPPAPDSWSAGRAAAPPPETHGEHAKSGY